MTVLALVIATIALTAWAFTVLAVGYVVYRYAFLPFKVCRADITALNAKVDGVASQIQVQRVTALSDEEIAHRERRQTARTQARQPFEMRSAP